MFTSLYWSMAHLRWLRRRPLTFWRMLSVYQTVMFFRACIISSPTFAIRFCCFLFYFVCFFYFVAFGPPVRVLFFVFFVLFNTAAAARRCIEFLLKAGNGHRFRWTPIEVLCYSDWLVDCWLVVVQSSVLHLQGIVHRVRNGATVVWVSLLLRCALSRPCSLSVGGPRA